jgi:hypothetical protein
MLGGLLRSVRHAVPLPWHQWFVTPRLGAGGRRGVRGEAPPPGVLATRLARGSGGAGGASCPAVKGECPTRRRRAGSDGEPIRP